MGHSVCYNEKNSKGETKMWELYGRWEDLWEGLLDDRFQLDEFKSLFLDTWRHFADIAATGKMKSSDLHLFIIMAKILGYDHYPSGIHNWEYEAATKFIEGFLKSVADGVGPMGIDEGFIRLETYCHCTSSAHIDQFEERFAQLCNEYGERYDFDDGQDID